MTIDFGRAEYQQSDLFFLSNNQKPAVDTTNRNMISVTLHRLYRNDSFSVYCLLSQPVFSAIKISGDNQNFSKEYSYGDYIESEINPKSNISAVLIFLAMLAGAILIVLSFYFLMTVYQFLKSRDYIS